MDGTGKLFKPFVEMAPSGFEVRTVTLIQEIGVSFHEQAQVIQEQINEPSIIIAESYSGSIALELIKLVPEKILHIYFVASFISSPSRLSRFGFILPEKLLLAISPKNPILLKYLFGRFLNSEIKEIFTQAIESVDPEVLKFRLTQISKLKSENSQYSVPATYLVATQDNLVDRKVIDVFKNCFPQLTVVSIEGTHFLLQTNPQSCWEAIQSHTL